MKLVAINGDKIIEVHDPKIEDVYVMADYNGFTYIVDVNLECIKHFRFTSADEKLSNWLPVKGNTWRIEALSLAKEFLGSIK